MPTLAVRSLRSLYVAATVGCLAVAIGLLPALARAAEAPPAHSLLFSLTGTKKFDPGPNHPPNGFEDPCGAAVDSHGDVYVADYRHNAIDVFAPSGSYLTQLAAENPIDGPCGLAVDSAGRLYVDNWHREVVRFAPTEFPPTESTRYGPATVVDSNRSTGVAVDPASGKVYVDDRTYVAVYEPSGHPVEVGGAPLKIGLDPGASYYGAAVSDFAATAGDVYLADAATESVKVFGPTGSLVTEIDGAGTPRGAFADLTDAALAIDQSDGHLYLAEDIEPFAEAPAALVEEFNSSGAYRGRLPGNLLAGEPSGLAVDNSAGATRGDVFVTSGNTEGGALYAFGPTAPAHSLTVAKSGAGRVLSEPAGVDCGSACAAEYNVGEVVILIAVEAAHSAFAGWTVNGNPGVCPTSRCRVTLGADTEVSAAFSLIPQQTLEVGVGGPGEGTVTSSPAGIECSSGLCSEHFNEGSTVLLTEHPKPHNRFTGWGGIACDESTATTCEVQMTKAESLSAAFAPIPQQTLTVETSGEGTITSAPAGIDCGATCSEHFDEASTVLLSAIPAPHNRLAAWSGCDAQPSPTECEVAIDAAASVSASFAPIAHQLTVSVSGAGQVGASSGPISACGAPGGTCSGSYAEGSVLALTATPAPGSRFTGWSGGGCSGTESCEVAIEADAELHAGFAPIHRTLAVSVGGTGFGSVTSQPAGIACGQSCAAVYEQGAVLTLTATPAPGSAFAGWSGCDSVAANRCTVALGADRTVTSVFNLTAPRRPRHHHHRRHGHPQKGGRR
jgi:DNA-binding beta-propeller fold protein YncE